MVAFNLIGSKTSISDLPKSRKNQMETRVRGEGQDLALTMRSKGQTKGWQQWKQKMGRKKKVSNS